MTGSLEKSGTSLSWGQSSQSRLGPRTVCHSGPGPAITEAAEPQAERHSALACSASGPRLRAGPLPLQRRRPVQVTRKLRLFKFH